MKRRLLPLGTAMLSSVMLICLFMACDDDGDTTSGSGGSTASGSGQGGSGGTGGSSSTGEGGIIITTGGNGGTGGVESCLATEAEAQQTPLDMIVLLDRSTSMQWDKWNGTVSALNAFFTNPDNQDISVGINYFPPASSSVDQCAAMSYNPLQVPIVPLSNGGAAVLAGSVNAATPGGAETPTYGALNGTLMAANVRQDANPDHTVVVVLASDGDPTACNTDIGDIAGLAATAYSYNGVRTFVIAIAGSTIANLDQIAAAGSTGQALDVTSDISLFQQKMVEIRRTVLACEYLIPDPQGVEFDSTKVNVVYTPGDGSPKQTIPQAANLDDCGGDQGWYYDDPLQPTKIYFCPATCDTLTNDYNAKVDFQFGCPTVIK